MTRRMPVHYLDPDGATDGQVPTYDATTGTVSWADGSTTGGGVAVEDEGIEVLATTARLNFVGAGVTVTDAGSGEATVTIPGGSGGSSTVEYGPLWPIDATPTTPNAMDDEFTGTSLASKWTVKAPAGGNPLTYTVADGFLFTDQPTPSTAWNLQGIYQPVPASGDWEFTAAVASMNPIPGNYIAPASLMLAEGLASTNKVRQVCYGTYGDNAWISEVIDSTWAAFSSTPASSRDSHTRQGYLRITKTGTNYAWKISPNGKKWLSLRSEGLTWTPAYVAIGGRSENANFGQSALWKWFRRTA